MKKIIILLSLLAVLIIVNTGFVNGAEEQGDCTCSGWGWETNNCELICEYPRCFGAGGDSCVCSSATDLSSAACTNSICTYYFNEYGEHAYWIASSSIYNAGDGTGTKNCCGNEAGERYVYSGVQGCCNSLDDCATSTGICVTTGLLDPSKPYRVCRDATGMARDDWHTCSSSSYANQLYEVVGKDYCCVNEGGWKWIGPFCTCQYSELVCENSPCGGVWADFKSECCQGSWVYHEELVGYVAGQTCGTLELGWCGDCFCGVPW